MAAPGADGALKPLQRAMKMATRGLQLDTGERPREAYVEYLKSVSFIAQTLAEEAEQRGGERLSCDSQKMLKLAEQCLERAKTTAERLGKADAEPTLHRTRMSDVPDPPPPIAEGPGPASTTAITKLRPSLSRPRGHRRSCSDDVQRHGGRFPSPEVFQMLLAAEAQSAIKELTPLEEASIQNQKLRAAYEVRLARLDPRQAAQKTSLTLSLQRQMMENLVIAKAREETLRRKAEERRQRLEAESSRLFSSKNETVTPAQQEQQVLHTDVLEYEQDHEWVKQCKAKIISNPHDAGLVSSYLSRILSTSGHPISKLVRTLQCQLYSLMYPLICTEPTQPSPSSKPSRHSLPAEASFFPAPASAKLRTSQSMNCLSSQPPRPSIQHSHSIGEIGENSELSMRGQKGGQEGKKEMESSYEDLEHLLSPKLLSEPNSLPPLDPEERLRMVVKEIHNARDTLLSSFMLAMDLPPSPAVKDACLEYLDENFFPPLWPALLALYRQALSSMEKELLDIMETHSSPTPSVVGVAKKLHPEDVAEPYQAAVEELKQLTNQRSPHRKLECIVRALRVICQCAEEYCPPRGGAAAIGADDLLPILAFVVLKSRMYCLVSECAALEEFIHEGFLIGEEGYCLTSLQTTLMYLRNLANQ